MDNSVRLLLQHFTDNDGPAYPSVLMTAIQAALEGGFLRKDEVGELIQCRITESGAEALAAANANLGHHATRYVHKTRFFPTVGLVPYEAPFLVPLSTPTKRVMGTLCI